MIKTIFVPLSAPIPTAACSRPRWPLPGRSRRICDSFTCALSPGEAAAYAPHTDFSVGSGITAALELLQKEVDTLAANAFANCHKFCEANAVRIQETPGPGESVSASWMEETENAAKRLMFHARHSDLLVLGRPRNRDFMPHGLIETLLVGSGRPVIIAPDSATAERDGLLSLWVGRKPRKRPVR